MNVNITFSTVKMGNGASRGAGMRVQYLCLDFSPFYSVSKVCHRLYFPITVFLPRESINCRPRHTVFKLIFFFLAECSFPEIPALSSDFI